MFGFASLFDAVKRLAAALNAHAEVFEAGTEQLRGFYGQPALPEPPKQVQGEEPIEAKPAGNGRPVRAGRRHQKL